MIHLEKMLLIITTETGVIIVCVTVLIGPLHDPVTWYKIIYTGEQVA